jgi:hypothetical protein
VADSQAAIRKESFRGTKAACFLSHGLFPSTGSMKAVSIRHADPAELDKPSVQGTETAKELHEWWSRWETLPAVVRDRPVAEVLAEERNRD